MYFLASDFVSFFRNLAIALQFVGIFHPQKTPSFSLLLQLSQCHEEWYIQAYMSGGAPSSALAQIAQLATTVFMCLKTLNRPSPSNTTGWQYNIFKVSRGIDKCPNNWLSVTRPFSYKIFIFLLVPEGGVSISDLLYSQCQSRTTPANVRPRLPNDSS